MLRRTWNQVLAETAGTTVWVWVNYIRVPGLIPKNRTATETQFIGTENVAP